MEVLDRTRKHKGQQSHSTKGRSPTKQIHSSDNQVSTWNFVQGLPVALYERKWFDSLDSRERQQHQASLNRFRFPHILIREQLEMESDSETEEDVELESENSM